MNDALEHLAGLGAIKARLAAHLPFLRDGGSLAPRATVLVGLAGTGKHSLPSHCQLHRPPLLPFTHLRATDLASIRFVDDPAYESTPAEIHEAYRRAARSSHPKAAAVS